MPERSDLDPELDSRELERLALAELVRLREVFNRPSGGQWAILYDPFRQRWIAVRGKSGWESAGTPAALEKLIDRA
ncbi:hypothetical protein [Actinomadura pelletieri]|uniref:hypothetical protein n=1 Tax=Actinomadura pelletieri TaxID=111805 RepID=UPI0011C432BA|nr:hypothetical protein [Actinomadura pelletieri]